MNVAVDPQAPPTNRCDAVGCRFLVRSAIRTGPWRLWWGAVDRTVSRETAFNQVVGCPRCPPASHPPSLPPSLPQKSRRYKTKREGTDSGGRPIKLAGKVIIQDISCLLPVHRVLGESYT